MNDNDIYVTFTDNVLPSDRTPGVSYSVTGGVTDNDGTPHALPSQPNEPSLDKAGPAILSARTLTVNTVELTFSEPVSDSTLSGGDFTFSGFTTAGANAAGVGFSTGSAPNDSIAVVTLAASIGVAETGQVRFTAAGLSNDAPGNANTQVAAVPVLVGINTAPMILSCQTVDANSDGFIDKVSLLFNKNMKDSTFVAAGDFTVAGRRSAASPPAA